MKIIEQFNEEKQRRHKEHQALQIQKHNKEMKKCLRSLRKSQSYDSKEVNQLPLDDIPAHEEAVVDQNLPELSIAEVMMN